MEIQVPSTVVSSTSVLMGLATVNTVFLFLHVKHRYLMRET